MSDVREERFLKRLFEKTARVNQIFLLWVCRLGNVAHVYIIISLRIIHKIMCFDLLQIIEDLKPNLKKILPVCLPLSLLVSHAYFLYYNFPVVIRRMYSHSWKTCNHILKATPAAPSTRIIQVSIVTFLCLFSEHFVLLCAIFMATHLDGNLENTNLFMSIGKKRFPSHIQCRSQKPWF